MNKYLKLSLVLILLSIGIHTYLTLHYYRINFGPNVEQSHCSISAAFNCDAVALSSFAAFMNIPIALFGGVTHVVLFFLVSFLLLGLVGNPAYVRRYSLWLSGLIAMTSVVMLGISITQLTSYCLYCIAAYGLSFLTLFTLWKAQTQAPSEGKGDHKGGKSLERITIKEGLRGLWTHSRGVSIMLALVPVFVFLMHHSLFSKHWSRRAKPDVVVAQSINRWMTQPPFEFFSPSLTKGPPGDQADMTVVEFADFFCSHCQRAASSLKIFALAHPQVRFEFYNFPLDGVCNKNIQRGRGLSCRLAKAVHCSGQQTQKWTFHDIVFEKQEEFRKSKSLSQLDELIEVYITKWGLDWEKLKACMDSVETQDTLLAQIESGKKAKIEGTPTIYVNGRYLSQGHSILILSKVLERSLELKRDQGE